ncbi:hypothetical protein FHS10_004937 [Mucilaginibacter dorajii]|nr:hypothetical protein [Mucilaginibacter dorajii]
MLKGFNIVKLLNFGAMVVMLEGFNVVKLILENTPTLEHSDITTFQLYNRKH